VVRQGEGDPRLPHPLPPAYPATPTLFQGVVQRVVRFAVGGSWQHHGLSVTGSGGVHLIHSAGHVAVRATRAGSAPLAQLSARVGAGAPVMIPLLTP